MPGEREELIQRLYTAVRSDALDPDLWHPDLVVRDATRPDPNSPDGHWHGVEGLRRYMADWEESFEESRPTPLEITEVGEALVAEVETTARGRGSGVQIENVRHHVWEFADDRVVRLTICVSRDEAIAAAGGGPDA